MIALRGRGKDEFQPLTQQNAQCQSSKHLDIAARVPDAPAIWPET